MNRRDFLRQGSAFLAGATLLPGLPNAVSGGGRTRPNIIVIVADDVTPNFLGCYGGPTPTPHLDALAADGVRFKQAHCTSPLCNPTRYSLLTGRYAGRNPNAYQRAPEGQQYWLGQSTKLTPADPSIARTMKAAGYHTGYVGKWHSNFDLGTDLSWPEDMDPDDPAMDQMLRERHAKHVAEIKRLTGFDHVGNLVVGNLDRKAKRAPKAGHHNPEWQTQGALEFINRAAAERKPFFLHLANTVPHSPDVLESLQQDTRYTQGGKLEAPITCHPPRHTVPERLTEAGLNTSGPLASINAGTIMLDDQVGVLRRRLQESGMADNTLIIWVADHSIYGKGTVYAPGTHVPMVAAWPGGIPAGGEVQTEVSLVDLFRTCAAAAGAELPEDAIDGESLLPLMRGQRESHGPVYMEVNWFRGVLLDGFHYVAFRPPPEVLQKMEGGRIEVAADQGWGDYRNIFGDLNLPFKPAYFEPDQLYRLDVDPFERHNLADRPAYAAKLQEMKARLSEVLQSFERPFPLEVPPFMRSARYADAVAKRKKLAEERTHYPEPYDAERIYNLNLKDPLAE